MTAVEFETMLVSKEVKRTIIKRKPKVPRLVIAMSATPANLARPVFVSALPGPNEHATVRMTR